MNAQNSAYKIALTGKIIDGYDETTVKQGLSKALKLTPDKFAEVWQKTPLVIAQNLSAAKAQHYQQSLRKLGAEVDIIAPSAEPAKQSTPDEQSETETMPTPIPEVAELKTAQAEKTAKALPIWVLIPLILLLAGAAYLILLYLPQGTTDNPFDNNTLEAAPEPEASPEPQKAAPLAQLKPHMRAEAWQALAYSSDGNYFAAAGDDVLLFDAQTRRLLKKLPSVNTRATAVEFAPDGSLLAVEYRRFNTDTADQNYAYRIVIYRLPDGAAIHEFDTLSADYHTRRALRFSPDMQHLATSNDQGIAVYDISIGKISWQWQQDKNNNPHASHSAFDVTPDWKYFLFNLERISYPSAVSTLKARYNDSARPFFWINRIAPDGRQAIAVGGNDGVEKKIFDLDSGELRYEHTGEAISQLAINGDFTLFAGEAEIWYPREQRSLPFKPYSNSTTMALALSPDGKELSIGNLYFQPDKLPTDAETLKQLRSWSPEWQDSIQAWMPSSFSQVYAEYSFATAQQIQVKVGNSTRLFALQTQQWAQQTQRLDMPSPPSGFHFSVKSFSPDLQHGVNEEAKLFYHRSVGNSPVRLISEEELNNQHGTPLFIDHQTLLFITSNTLYKININSQEQLAVLPIQAEEIKDIAVSNNQGYAMLLEEHWEFIGKQYFAVYDLQTPKTVITRTLGQAGGAVFSPDNQAWWRFYGKQIDRYDLSTGQITKTFNINSGRILSLSISPDGQQFMTTNSNGLAEIYNSQDGSKAYTFAANDLYNLIAFDTQGEPLDFVGQLAGMFYDK